MGHIENAVALHYGNVGLLGRIIDGLEAVGVDFDNLKTIDLAPVDEFHIGGREATAAAVERMALNAEHRVLDIGCGIGGASRYIAETIGCQVDGVDLTPEYVLTAKALTEMIGLEDKVSHEIASALAMPFTDDAFDAAITFHVAMNIPERDAFYREIARVLKPGGTLCLYDVMKVGETPVTYPMPWAQSIETSHLTTIGETGTLLDGAGFTVVKVDDRTAEAVEFFERMAAARAGGPPPPLGVHLAMGADAAAKIGNARRSIAQGEMAPVMMVARLG